MSNKDKKTTDSNLPIVDPNSGIAKTMNYVHDHTQKKNDNGNMCVTCGYYTQKEERKGKQYGTCTFFGNKGIVPATAWCAHWKKKA